MAYRTIIIKGDGVGVEAVANAAITPGMVCQLMSTGKVRAHANAGQNAEALIAIEDELQGREIGTAYSADNVVLMRRFQPGDEFYGLINDGENIAIGDYLESAGNGKLRKHTADSAGAVEYPNAIIGVALEAVDMSDSSAADPSGRCIVRVT